MKRPRRNRFRATVAQRDGSTRDVDLLVYGGEDEARALAVAKGLRVLSLTTPDAMKREGGFTLDRRAIREACVFLDIDYSAVKLRLNGRVGPTNGNYRRRGYEHNIMLKSYLTPEQASQSLWHELAHAMQAERVERDGGTWHAYASAQRRWSYSTRPIEVEARSYEQYAEELPLCK